MKPVARSEFYLHYFHFSGSNLLFTMDTPTTPSRTAGYHLELDHIWAQLNDEMRKPGNKVKHMKDSYCLVSGEGMS